jgi:hypothetical protein
LKNVEITLTFSSLSGKIAAVLDFTKKEVIMSKVVRVLVAAAFLVSVALVPFGCAKKEKKPLGGAIEKLDEGVKEAGKKVEEAGKEMQK